MSNKYNLRQIYIYQCLSMLNVKSESLFLDHLMSEFIALANDKVVNVRMCMSEVLKEHY